MQKAVTGGVLCFPRGCFTEDTKGGLDEEYMSILKEQLSEEEMEIILSDGDKEIPVEIRFKIVEIFQESKIKLAGLLQGNNKHQIRKYRCNAERGGGELSSALFSPSFYCIGYTFIIYFIYYQIICADN